MSFLVTSRAKRISVSGLAAAMIATIALGTSTKPAEAGADPLLGEIMTVGFNFCPRGWAQANGQLLPISQNQALFSLYGTIYGGDGRTTFALPDLRGRSAVHNGSGPGLPAVTLGQKAGSTSFTLNQSNLPSHTHAATATLHAHEEAGDSDAPGGALPAAAEENLYSTAAADTTMGSAANPAVTVTVTNAGSSQPVTKRSPMLGMMVCVALTGIFPSRN